MTTLFHFWSSPSSQRIRLALNYKGISFENRPLNYDEDDLFFELGIARQVPILQCDNGELLTDSVTILENIDRLFPDTPPLQGNQIHHQAWKGVLDWRNRVDPVLERLYAPIRPAYRDIGDNEMCLSAYKQEIQYRYGMSIEELANDRYDGFYQFQKLSRLNELARHLTKDRYYMGTISIADILLTADLAPLQLLDGISLPIDMMYYLQRIAEKCQTDLEKGLIIS